MHTFNKNKALKKINNKNNKKVKIFSVVVAIVILIGAIIYFSFARFESTQSFSLINGTAKQKYIVDQIIEFKNNGASDLGYDGIDSLGEYGTVDNNLRYIGATPNNYIYFNCSTTNASLMNNQTCEKWRIVGVFNNLETNSSNTESRVRIIRDEPLGYYSWDSDDGTLNNGNGINQWGKSTYEDETPYEGADLMRELNYDYLGTVIIGSDGKWYSNTFNEKETDMPETKINNNALKMIETVKWNMGTSPNNKEFIYNQAYTSYSYERGTRTSADYQDNVIRTSSWTGKVALPYASDHVYSTMNFEEGYCLSMALSGYGSVVSCNNASWLFKKSGMHLLLNTDDYNNSNSVVYFSGEVFGTVEASEDDLIIPTLYLKKNVKIVGGNGKSTNPYKITIE